MIDKKTFRRRVLLRIVGHPVTTWSGVTAVALGTVAMLMQDPALPAFGAVCALLLSIGMAGFNLIYRAEDLAKDTIDTIQGEERERVEHRLHSLRARLVEDGDTRDEEALDDLVTLVGAFKDERSIVRNLDTVTATEILTGVDRLFEQCVSALEGSVRNRELIGKLSHEASAPLRTQREEVITQVQSGVRELGNILSGAQKLVARKQASAGSATAIARETDELRQSLELASRVEERMRGLGGERQYDEYLNKT